METSAPGPLRELWNYRELLWMWTLREVKVRYKQSLLGAAWAILQPLVLMIIFTVVFSWFARIPTDGVPYPIFSYTALLPWTLLATSVSFAAPSLVNNMTLVTKIYFPKEILPLACVGAAVLDFLIAGLVFVGLAVYYDVPATAALLWLPLLLAIQTVLIVGVSLLLAAINVFYRDIRFVVPLGLQLWMYVSPVIYPVSLVPEKARFFYLLNPMASLINSYRSVVLEGVAPSLEEWVPAAVISAALCAWAYRRFKRLEPEFADLI